METEMGVLSGPMFEPAQSGGFKSLFGKQGAHYNIFEMKTLDDVRRIFPDGEANYLNFALFSTSGVHGSYTTIEEVELGLTKYGADAEFDSELWPDDYHGDTLTILIVHPRLVCLRYGEIPVTLADIPYLKKLRETSWRAVVKIGTAE